jgi:hypothetical protein
MKVGDQVKLSPAYRRHLCAVVRGEEAPTLLGRDAVWSRDILVQTDSYRLYVCVPPKNWYKTMTVWVYVRWGERTVAFKPNQLVLA